MSAPFYPRKARKNAEREERFFNHRGHSAENRNRLKKRSTKDAKEHEEDTEFFLSSLRLCASAVINSLCGVWERRINRRGAETQRRKKKTFTKNKKWPDSNTEEDKERKEDEVFSNPNLFSLFLCDLCVLCGEESFFSFRVFPCLSW
uniref:Uncharacterized protein n=1 Tax=Candidatus Kentrum sp. FM TaxID=2126340 RepID=A0A450SFK0_9GAMM|nr:MAG: hypothetical protein BECKFM1743C_GA0114222_100997 [Candidatus Kentron sp. FM]